MPEDMMSRESYTAAARGSGKVGASVTFHAAQ